MRTDTENLAEGNEIGTSFPSRRQPRRRAVHPSSQGAAQLLIKESRSGTKRKANSSKAPASKRLKAHTESAAVETTGSTPVKGQHGEHYPASTPRALTAIGLSKGEREPRTGPTEALSLRTESKSTRTPAKLGQLKRSCPTKKNTNQKDAIGIATKEDITKFDSVKQPPNSAATVLGDNASRECSQFRLPVKPISGQLHEKDTGRATKQKAGGLWRSTRRRIKPLEWWRGDRAEYGRARFEDGPNGSTDDLAGPTLRQVHRATRAEGEGTFSGLHFTKHKRRSSVRASRRARASAASTSYTAKHDSIPSERKGSRSENDSTSLGREGSLDEFVELDPTADNVAVEDGMDDETERIQRVWDPDMGQEVERVITCTSRHMDLCVPQGQSYAFEKLLDADDTLAAGVLSIPVGQSKPSKSSSGSNYVCTLLLPASAFDT